MQKTSRAQRDDIALRILTDLSALYPALNPVPNVLGPAYGARLCDRACAVLRAVEHLLIGLDGALSQEAWERADLSWKEQRPARTWDGRNTLRQRAGLPPIGEAETRLVGRSYRFPSLALHEHVCLGADLKQLHAALVHAECALGNGFGKAHDLLRRATKAVRVLLQLRSGLDSIVATEQRGGSDRDMRDILRR